MWRTMDVLGHNHDQGTVRTGTAQRWSINVVKPLEQTHISTFNSETCQHGKEAEEEECLATDINPPTTTHTHTHTPWWGGSCPETKLAQELVFAAARHHSVLTRRQKASNECSSQPIFWSHVPDCSVSVSLSPTPAKLCVWPELITHHQIQCSKGFYSLVFVDISSSIMRLRSLYTCILYTFSAIYLTSILTISTACIGVNSQA